MARLRVDDSKGNKIGEIDDQPKQQIAYDARGKRAGRFDKQKNSTFDAAGKEIGKGNQLKKLLGG